MRALFAQGNRVSAKTFRPHPEEAYFRPSRRLWREVIARRRFPLGSRRCATASLLTMREPSRMKNCFTRLPSRGSASSTRRGRRVPKGGRGPICPLRQVARMPQKRRPSRIALPNFHPRQNPIQLLPSRPNPARARQHRDRRTRSPPSRHCRPCGNRPSARGNSRRCGWHSAGRARRIIWPPAAHP